MKRIAGRTLATLGIPGVSGEHIRASFRRPFSEFYASLLGRPVSAEEFAFCRRCSEQQYEAKAQSESHGALTTRPAASAAAAISACAGVAAG